MSANAKAAATSTDTVRNNRRQPAEFIRHWRLRPVARGGEHANRIAALYVGAHRGRIRLLCCGTQPGRRCANHHYIAGTQGHPAGVGRIEEFDSRDSVSVCCRYGAHTVGDRFTTGDDRLGQRGRAPSFVARTPTVAERSCRPACSPTIGPQSAGVVVPPIPNGAVFGNRVTSYPDKKSSAVRKRPECRRWTRTQTTVAATAIVTPAEAINANSARSRVDKNPLCRPALPDGPRLVDVRRQLYNRRYRLDG
ncbi:hypothetical protein LX13_000601 [Williamsia maris]|uniref:Uncharacterized protein n=1 Tax=Williamsia maris TaxID=72806 RepID=A0ABT1H964_9NOCA|nr:hypothetical protein [Williamsia maris]